MDIPKHTGRGSQIQDISGQRFHDLTVICFAGRNKHRQTLWECLCDCGNKITVPKMSLVTENTKSCGCRHKPHGKTGTPEYEAWSAISKRCRNKNHKAYDRYGGRGIVICERWADFTAFLEDVGEKPSDNLSIDRIDNSKGYECGKCADCALRGTTKMNCRWATRKEQQRNRRNNTLITHDGVTRTLAEWAEITGIHRSVISRRWRLGKSIVNSSRQ